MIHLLTPNYWCRILAFFLALIIQVACSSQSRNALTQEKDQLTFGRGGGISGEIQSHILMNDGQLYTTSSLYSDTIFVSDLTPETTLSLFEHLDSMQLTKLEFRHPGNRYYFLRYQDKEIVWGDRDNPPPQDVQQFYDSLQSIVPKQK